MFVDRVKVRVSAGDGGNGCCSFRREKYIPLGGPDGGDGGRGGDVIFEATTRMASLLDLRYNPHAKGERGVHGKGKDMHGRGGSEAVVQVPCGTMIRDFETGEILADLKEEGERFVAAKGGSGGRGNARFATQSNKAPHFAEKGEPGEDREYQLELKVIAEVGLVGLPNAGKSTFLSVVSAAKPKIADYPFTTLSPNLGVVGLSGYRSLTVADIPGIIEGAAEGKGLGHDFLRHIDRTRVLLFLIDLGDEDPAETYAVLDKELSEYSETLAQRPRLLAFNKIDVTENRERFPLLKAQFPDAWGISAATGENVPPLLEALWHAVDAAKQAEEAEADVEEGPVEGDIRYEAPYTIEKEGKSFRIEGDRVMRAVRMTNFDNEEAVQHLQKSLSKMGIFKALKRLGAQPGQTIFLGELEMEYHPD